MSRITITYDCNYSAPMLSYSPVYAVAEDVDSMTIVSPDSKSIENSIYHDNHRDGYRFVEWNTASDGTGTRYMPGDTVTSDVDLYAIWEVHLTGTTWIFNNEIGASALLNYAGRVDAGSEGTLFTCNEYSFGGMYVDARSVSSIDINYLTVGFDIEEIAYSSSLDGWAGNIYKTITFTSEPTNCTPFTVDDFMLWLQSNAELQDQTVLNDTMWMFRQTLSLPSTQGNGKYAELLTGNLIQSNGSSYSRINLYWDTDRYVLGYEIESGGETTYFDVYDPDNPALWRHGTEYRTFMFVAEPATYYPSKKEFIKWLRRNATQIDTALNGTTWTFKNTPTATSASTGCASSNGRLFAVNGDINEYNGLECNSTNIDYTYPSGQTSATKHAYTFSGGTWFSDAAKTVTFMKEPDRFSPDKATFITWLMANATKQENSEQIDLDIEQTGSMGVEVMGSANGNVSVEVDDSANGSVDVGVNGDNNEEINMSVEQPSNAPLSMTVQAGTSVRMPVDATLRVSGAAADAKVAGTRLRALENDILKKMNGPTDGSVGLNGQYLRSNGDGTVEWDSIGTPTDEQVAEVMTEWLDEHPEATTTVQDGSISYVKLANAIQTLLDKTVDGGYVEDGSLYLTHNEEVVAGPFTGFGGGGGGGSGGGSANSAFMSMENVSGWAARSVASGSSVNLTISWSSIEDGMETGEGSMTVINNGTVVIPSRSVPQGIVNVDVGEYLSTGSNVVQIRVSDSYGNSRVKNFTITVMELRIESSFDESVIQSGAFNFIYTPYGDVRKTIQFSIDGNIIGTYVTSESGQPQTYTVPAQAHGAHTLDVRFTSTIGGQSIPSNTLHYDIIWAIEGNTTPIIASNFNTSVVDQWMTLTIPFIAYDPSSLVSTVVVKVDGETVTTMPNVDRTMNSVDVMMDTSGSHTIRLQNGSAYKDLQITVNAVEMTITPVTDNLALYLTSSGRSNLEEHPEVWTYTDASMHTYTATLTGFNFVSNGWVRDPDNIVALRVGGGASVSIPYNMFSNSSDIMLTGKTIEIEFAVRNVQDYTQPIISCFSGNRGLKITSQMASVKSNLGEIGVQFKDDDHVRISFVYYKQTENMLQMVYINGIPSRVVQYDENDTFAQTTPVGITISGAYSDVDIYNIRVYDTNLTERQILNNWIADTQDGALLQQRYSRNNIYDAYGQIAISKLPGNLPYLVIECPQLPQYKGDKKTCSGRFVNPSDTSKSFTFTGCQINVQGTSSAVYVRKNYDMQFKSGFETSGGHIDNYQMTSSVKAFNRFVMKADVASSEGANNVELVKLYNDIAPYRRPEMVQDAQVRYGIYGFPIVIFWTNTDNNTTTFLGKYNFNFPKRAPGPYGYSGNMESWEFQNNTSNLMLFKSDYFDETLKADDEGNLKETWRFDYEARFPDDTWVDYSKLQEFQSFVYSTYQAEATNNALSSSVTYDGVTYTTDSSAYRLAKFKNEIGKYAEINSLIFYYVFTEFFLLADSRAKNLFIGFSGSNTDANLNLTIDRKAVAEPYDMDTALGINNEGSLTFTYSLEDTMTTSDNRDVFTGQSSVLWNNVRDAFPNEIRTMYQTLRSGQVMNYATIEQRFEDHQAYWPEAIWIEDSKFKYIYPLTRPDTGKQPTDAYLEMMLGSKLEQRRWWLSNRFKYMDSKWNSGDALSEVIQFRAYATASLTVTPYTDLYVRVKYGSYNGQQRALQGQAVTISVPIDSLSDTETYVYSASQIADVGDMKDFQLGWADFSHATRIQRIKIGDSSSNYQNLTFTRLTLGNNQLLQSVDCRNCPNMGTGEVKTVNLSGCTSIKEAYFDGTSILGVNLPNASPIETLHLPGTVASLVLRNQTKLTDFVCGTDAQHPDYSNIETLWLENPTSAVDTFEIISDMPAGSYVRLFGFHWELEDLDDVSDIFDKLDTMLGLDQNGNKNMPKPQMLGTIHVVNADGDNYGRIQARYPDVTITYDNIISYLYYYAYDGTGDPLYTETIVNGNNGTYDGMPARTATARYTYTFAGWSRTPNGAADATATQGVIASRNVYAAYTSTLRSYEITFVKDNVDGGGTLQTLTVNYGEQPYYTGALPVSTNDDGGDYVFNGWTDGTNEYSANALPAVTGAATYTAVFRDERLRIIYVVDGTTVKTEYVYSGNDGTGTDSTPTKESSVSTVYTFVGWTTTQGGSVADANALKNVTADRTVYAVFSESVRTYTIVFKRGQADGGGNLESKQVAYGETPTYTGATPTSTAQGIWVFSSWNPQITTVTGDAEYVAVFQDVSVTIEYYNGNTKVYTETIANGSNASGPSTNPTKASTAQYTYTFAGWNSDNTATEADANALTHITHNTTLYAVFTETVRTYTITFVRANEDGGGQLQSSAWEYGSTPSYSGTPTTTKTGNYRFTGWTPAIATVTGAATYTAVFEEVVSDVIKYLARNMTAYESNTATKVAQYAFYSMTTLTNVETSATTIETYAFNGCSNLESVDLTASSGAVSIASNAFYSCSKLMSIFIRSSDTATLASADLPTQFTSGKGAIYVPAAKVDTYKATSPWSTYASHIFSIDDYPVTNFDTIKDDLTTFCTKLANGTATYDVGDFKTIDLGTEGQIRMQVAAKNADALASGSGNAAYTWVAMDLLNTYHRMNPLLSGTTEGTGAIGGWGKSEMRTYLNETIWPLLPSELRAVIKEVTKYSCIYDTSGTKVSDDTTTDKLWIPSVHEVFNSTTYETQGPAYTGIFSSNTNRKRFKPGASNADDWCERSAYSTSNFRNVNYNGTDSNSNANTIFGVLLGFCT